MTEYYRLAEGTDVVPLDGDAVLFRSDVVSLHLEGESAVTFAERILPLLDGRRTVADVAADFPDLDVDDLRTHLAGLADAGVLRRSERPRERATATARDPFRAMLEALGVPADEGRERLRRFHVVVFGLEAHGAWAADALARAGVGRMTLVDPFPAEPADFALLPWREPAEGTDGLRQELARRALERSGVEGSFATFESAPLEADDVLELAGEADFLLGTFERGFGAAHQWVNRGALRHRVPALFGELRGTRMIAGPLVLPEEGACYLCWKMRTAACATDFRTAMGYEEHLDGRRRPGQHARPSLPPAAAQLGSMLAMEVLRTALALDKPAYASRVEELDLLGNERTVHTVLQRPDCPACQKKKDLRRPERSLGELASSPGTPGDLLAAAPELVSDACGIIRHLEPVPRDPSEPAVPYVVRAELANHRFLEDDDDAFMPCSGKGMSREQARLSALGEAAERYSASLWGREAIQHVPRSEVNGPSLDPRRLVLYRPDQYPDLPYAPYEDDATLGWVPARALGADEVLHVPAIGVYMAYDPRSHDELLFPPTSNGLAAGPTLADAVLAAAYEVLERDAFLTTWLTRLPADRVDVSDHPDADVRTLQAAYARRSVALELYRLPTDHPCHVFMGIGVAEDGREPAAVVGLGADLDPGRAALGALLEVGQVRPALRIRLRDPKIVRRRDELLEAPERVETLEDHDLLYTSHSRLDGFEFLRRRPPVSMDWSDHPAAGAAARLEVLVEALGQRGTDLLYCDLTTLDLGARGVHTVRALVPDFQPIYFGVRERRVGGPRLYELPVTLGFRSDPVAFHELNPDPHPLA